MSGTEAGEALSVDKLFRLLGNDLRMRIMRALWNEFDFHDYVTDTLDPVPFSELLKRTRIHDSGNFNYHLARLADVLVEHREEGYILTSLGFNVMHAIDAYATFDYETVPATEIDDACPFCEGILVVSYERELVHVRCRNCGGLAGDGNVQFVKVPATGAQRLDLSTMLDVATLQLESRVRSSRYRFCWECHNRLDSSLAVCENHVPGPNGLCDECEARYAAEISVDCSNCGLSGVGPLLEYAFVTSSVRGCFERDDKGPGDIGPWQYRLQAFEAVTERIVSTEPITVAYEFSVGDGSLRVTITDDGTAIDVKDG